MKTKIFLLLSLFLALVILESNNSKAKRPHVIIKTQYGYIEIELYNKTPKHRDNFLKLVKDTFYRDLLFHRVIKGFVIQGGDPESKNAKPWVKLGNGGLNYTIEPEMHPDLFHKKGALAAAREADNVNPRKLSSSTQFYIVLGKVLSESDLNFLETKRNKEIYNKKYDELLRSALNNKDSATLHKRRKAQEEALAFSEKNKFKFSKAQRKQYTKTGGTPHLDGNYTVFGEVTEGMEVVEKIANLHTDNNDRPYEDVRFTITIKN